MEIISRKPLLRPLPTFGRIAGFEKSPSGRHEVEIVARRRAADVMNVQIIDAAADILPSFTVIEAADDPAMLQADVENLWIVRMDEDVTHVLSVRRPRIAPLSFDLRWQVLNTGQLLP